MKVVSIYRKKQGDEGTFGELVTSGFSCFTLELPWRDNRTNLSCIPAGIYQVSMRYSPKYKKYYYGIEEVKGRSGILIHSGNFAGDKEKGLLTHSEGCIVIGKSLGRIQGQAAILSSRSALSAFKRHMENMPFELTIHDL